MVDETDITPPPQPITPKQSSPAPVTPNQPITRSKEELTTIKKYLKVDECLEESGKTVEKKPKVKKGTAPPFNLNCIDLEDISKFETAAIIIEKHVRGFLARLHFRRKLINVPHVLLLKIDFADGLPLNNDFMGSKPDV